jgi:hypothetical protein
MAIDDSCAKIGGQYFVKCANVGHLPKSEIMPMPEHVEFVGNWEVDEPDDGWTVELN